MGTAYHYTTYSNWQRIRKEGLQPYLLNKPPALGGDTRGVWLWPERLEGIAHVGSVLWQVCMKGATEVVLLQCKYDPTTLAGYPDEWTIKHSGRLENLEFHDSVPCIVVTVTIPPEDIELVEAYDLMKMCGTREVV